MNIAVTGADGQLGRAVTQVLLRQEHTVYKAALPLLDICDGKAVEHFLHQNRPEAVIHCAAYTHVDQAEQEPKRCHAVNVTGSEHIANCCARLNARLLYVSTDYVFDGSGNVPHETDDPTGPLQVYGKTKLLGEQAVQSLCPQSFVVRTSWLFGEGNNFVRTIVHKAKESGTLSVVEDQIGSPTYTQDLAALLCEIIATQYYGVYHATNEGFCSWAEMARQVLWLAGSTAQVFGVTSAQYPTPAQRPKNSRLSKSSLENAGFMRLPAWQDALEKYMRHNCDKAAIGW